MLLQRGVERASKLTAAVLAAGLAWTGQASAAPLPGFVLVGQTEHFAFYSRDGRGLDGEKSERYVRRLEGLFGLSVSGRSDYYRCERPEDVAFATGLYASGVTSARDRRIFSVRDFHAHELVHYVAGQIGNGGAFFDEGLAVALSGEALRKRADLERLARTAAGRLPVSQLVARFESLEPEGAYALAGSFVGFLIEDQGMARVSEFLRACGPAGADPAAAFHRVFGRTLDEAGDAWRASLATRG